ncbi:hypothetical protein BTA51_29500 [Hahella sp. CCB-MM4]|uniref:hypothetical protein n=1 Tax=Hahella sp. (strain CCB-MM4) TaxID=1926491 RepID=UPI000B9BC4CC|nr:hypothetical protein [Hahella sp. CCB-MM4]OZG69761.1 hypothetical protein BTA51_29500 [Hahella sp. CCB-MM4]
MRTAIRRILVFLAPVVLSSTVNAEESPFGADWPPGPGSMEAGGLCSACHSLALVKQQGLTRESWNETLTWMQEEQGMPELDPAMRELILDYLSKNFNPESHQQRSAAP